MLSALRALAQATALPPPSYQLTTVAWYVDLAADGSLMGFTKATGQGRGRGVRQPAPYVKRTNAVNPKLLVDRAEYALGLPLDVAHTARASRRHSAFCALVRAAADATRHPYVEAVARFLAARTPDSLALPKGMLPTEVVAFRVEGLMVAHLPEVQAFWARLIRQGCARGALLHARCLVCGEVSAALLRFPLRLQLPVQKHLAAGEFACAHLEAFHSHGLRHLHNSPICADCAEDVGQTLNHLLTDETSHLALGGVVLVCWTDGGKGPSPTAFLAQPLHPEPATADPGTGTYYALGLSRRNARAVVRDFTSVPRPEAEAHLRSWQRALRLVSPDGQTVRTLPLPVLAQALARQPGAGGDFGLLPALWRTALLGEEPPLGLVARALGRRRAPGEGPVGEACAALLKLALTLRGDDMTQDSLTSLAADHPGVAYRCGRLLAVVEQIQRCAIPRLTTTVADRTFGAFSAHPARHLTLLVRQARAQLSRLTIRQADRARSLDALLQDILAGMREVPDALDLTGQAELALGYYHQRAALAREASSERKPRAGEVG